MLPINQWFCISSSVSEMPLGKYPSCFAPPEPGMLLACCDTNCGFWSFGSSDWEFAVGVEVAIMKGVRVAGLCYRRHKILTNAEGASRVHRGL